MGQGRSIPEDASAFARNARAKIGIIEIKYVSTEKGDYGNHKVIQLKLEGLTTERIINYVNEIKMHAKNHGIMISCNVGPGFTPTRQLSRIVPNYDIQGILAGTRIDALRILGETVSLPNAEKRQWWEDIKYFITYLGLTFHSKSEITFEPMDLLESNTQGLKFESDNKDAI
jgi:hypothetical protein